MHVRVIALYPCRISSLAGRPGVRYRKHRKKPDATVIPCKVEVVGNRSIAMPELDIPAGTPQPTFKAQLEATRAAVEQRRIVCVPLSTEPEALDSDPEQNILSPIFR